MKPLPLNKHQGFLALSPASVPFGINLRASSLTGISSDPNPPSSASVPFGTNLRAPSLTTKSPAPVLIGVNLRESPISLPIFPARHPPTVPLFETAAHCFEVKITAAEARNNRRFETRNDLDRRLVGTLPANILSIFDAPRVTPDDDDFAPPPWLLETIDRVASSPGVVPKPPPFLFRTDAAALEHNAALLKKYDYDLSKLLPDFQDTTVAYGSEFRPIEDPRIIFGKHPNFDFFESTVLNGMDYHFTSELTENERMAELLAQWLGEIIRQLPQTWKDSME